MYQRARAREISGTIYYAQYVFVGWCTFPRASRPVNTRQMNIGRRFGAAIRKLLSLVRFRAI